MKSVSSFFRVVAMLLTIALLGGCMLARSPAPMSILAPAIETAQRPTGDAVDWSLQVQRPVTDSMRDSDRVLVRLSPSRLQVYAGAAWLDSAPELMQALMIRSFADAGSFAGVSRAGGMRTRYSLASELRHFEAVDDGGPDLEVVVALQANLIHQRSARAVASRSFVQQHRIQGKALDDLVAGFETALHGLMEELIDWVFEESAAADARAEQAQETRGRWRREQ